MVHLEYLVVAFGIPKFESPFENSLVSSHFAEFEDLPYVVKKEVKVNLLKFIRFCRDTSLTGVVSPIIYELARHNKGRLSAPQSMLCMM
jgi:hypothetical protein